MTGRTSSCPPSYALPRCISQASVRRAQSTRMRQCSLWPRQFSSFGKIYCALSQKIIVKH
nr:hypothetical protein [Trichoderma harzianum]